MCELEAGNPSHQVPRFQMIAAASSAKTIAMPAVLLTCKMSSTGSSDTIPQATAPLAVRTPRKLHNPDHMTAYCGARDLV